MQVSELLLKTMEDLGEDDFGMLKWYLSMNVIDGCNPIPKSRLERASRWETVDKMTQTYREELAVKVTVEILKKMNFNAAAEELRSNYEAVEGNKSTSSTAVASHPAAPAMMTAQQGGVIIAATVAGGTSGSWNININK